MGDDTPIPARFQLPAAGIGASYKKPPICERGALGWRPMCCRGDGRGFVMRGRGARTCASTLYVSQPHIRPPNPIKAQAPKALSQRERVGWGRVAVRQATPEYGKRPALAPALKKPPFRKRGVGGISPAPPSRNAAATPSSFRRRPESRTPVSPAFQMAGVWIPAFAGMTVGLSVFLWRWRSMTTLPHPTLSRWERAFRGAPALNSYFPNS